MSRLSFTQLVSLTVTAASCAARVCADPVMVEPDPGIVPGPWTDMSELRVMASNAPPRHVPDHGCASNLVVSVPRTNLDARADVWGTDARPGVDPVPFLKQLASQDWIGITSSIATQKEHILRQEIPALLIKP